jgi:hypothetical protein
MEYVIVAVTAAISFIYGFKRGYEYREKEAIQKLDNLMETIVEQEEENTIRIKLEEVNGMFFVYREDDDTFMGQGKTKKEITEVLNARFPDKRFTAHEKNLKEVGFPHE